MSEQDRTALVISCVTKVRPRHLEDLQITEDTRLRDDLSLDSLGYIALIFVLEDEFQLALQSQAKALAMINTVRELDQLIRTQLEAAASTPAPRADSHVA